MNSGVNRADRNAMIAVIREYLGEKIPASGFDEQLSAIAARTDDPTVKWVSSQLWFTYDDCRDHPVVSDKPGWDLIQRLILLLESDARVEVEVGPAHWTARQGIAGACLAGVGWIVWETGWGSHLLITNLPFGLVSMGLSFWQRHEPGDPGAPDPSLAPFQSVGQLRSVRRRVRSFIKARYPRHLETRRIRGPLSEFALWLQFGALWLMFSPVALLCQLRPERQTQWRVVGG
jgi:hypothetical protein